VLAAIFPLALITKSDTLARPLFFVLSTLLSYPLFGLFVLALVSASVVVAWFQKAKTTVEIVFTSLYSVTIVLYFVFVIWCLVTKPEF
jgi:apolipoprotein N-acyltransferase